MSGLRFYGTAAVVLGAFVLLGGLQLFVDFVDLDLTSQLLIVGAVVLVARGLLELGN